MIRQERNQGRSRAHVRRRRLEIILLGKLMSHDAGGGELKSKGNVRGGEGLE